MEGESPGKLLVYGNAQMLMLLEDVGVQLVAVTERILSKEGPAARQLEKGINQYGKPRSWTPVARLSANCAPHLRKTPPPKKTNVLSHRKNNQYAVLDVLDAFSTV